MLANTKQYGTIQTYNATNVIASRGSDDPWGLLTLIKPKNPTMLTHRTDGTGHCGDMAPPADNDSESLKQFRAIVLKKVKEWIDLSDTAKISKPDKIAKAVIKDAL